MKIIISESQFNKLILTEQDSGFTRRLDKIYSDPETASEMNQAYKKLPEDLINLKNQNQFVFDTLVQLGLWFIPLAGPFLSTAYGTKVAIDKLKDGKYAEGIIGIITSPLGLSRTIRLLEMLKKGSPRVIEMLKSINKTGITVLSAQGKQKFMEWGLENYGDDFFKFYQLLGDKNKMESLLNSINQK